MKTILATVSIALVLFCHAMFGQEKALDSVVQSYIENRWFNGTVLVQKDAEIIYNKSFGLADRRFDIPNTNNTAYKLASTTKAFTAVLILQLYEDGKLELHKSIDHYLPEFKGQEGAKITVHQLLNHTSKLTQFDTITELEDYYKYGIPLVQLPKTSDEIMQIYAQKPLEFEPGTKYSYNNHDYHALGKIIEHLSGKLFEQVLNERIIEPLGMESTGYLRNNYIIKNLATPYFFGESPYPGSPVEAPPSFEFEGKRFYIINDPLPYYIENWFAGAAMYATANDMLKFSNALFDHKLLKKETLDLMLTPNLEKHGYGIWIDGEGADFRTQRMGTIFGSNSVWMHFFEDNSTIIILSNIGTTNLWMFCMDMHKTLNREKP